MSTRLVGVESTAPRLPQGVIDASTGTGPNDLAAGDHTHPGGGGGGDGGGTGIVIDDTPPADTELLWGDTSTEGQPIVQTIQVFIYTDEADPRPDATVVFWIPDPFDLPNPFGAIEGDCVLRSTPNMLTGLNGVDAIWKGTAAEYDALSPADDTVYFVYEPEAP